MERLKQKLNEVNRIINNLNSKTKTFEITFYVSKYHETVVPDKYPLTRELRLAIDVFYFDRKTRVKVSKEIMEMTTEYVIYDEETVKQRFFDGFDGVLEHFQKILMFGTGYLDIENIRSGDAILGAYKTRDKNGNPIYYSENKSTELSNKTFNQLIEESKLKK